MSLASRLDVFRSSFPPLTALEALTGDVALLGLLEEVLAESTGMTLPFTTIVPTVGADGGGGGAIEDVADVEEGAAGKARTLLGDIVRTSSTPLPLPADTEAARART
jgi:hypothetical protein